MAESAAIQASLDSAVEVIHEQDNTITGAVLAFAAVRKLYDDAATKVKALLAAQNITVDTSALDAASAEAKARTAELATAIAANTPASGEVHEDDGGTGTAPVTEGGTVVDPAAVDTSPVETPAAEEPQG